VLNNSEKQIDFLNKYLNKKKGQSKITSNKFE